MIAALFLGAATAAQGQDTPTAPQSNLDPTLEAGEAGKIRRCHPHDPSWHNWPVLEHAVIDNIVPDFPLINKSFNLSYSGVDL